MAKSSIKKRHIVRVELDAGFLESIVLSSKWGGVGGVGGGGEHG